MRSEPRVQPQIWQESASQKPDLDEDRYHPQLTRRRNGTMRIVRHSEAEG